MKKFTFLFTFLMTISNLFAQNTYILCGKLIDTKFGKIKTKQTLIVAKNKIINVLDGYVMPRSKTAKTIDLKDKVVMPGLIDLHVHIESEYDKQVYLNRFTKNEVDIALRATSFAKITLEAGFTSVRDLGGTGVNISLRNAINNRYIVGPRIFTAGKTIGTTSGHANPTNEIKKSLMENPRSHESVVNSVDNARKSVRQRYKEGADVIKITTTGGLLSMAKNEQNPQFTLEEIKAICSTAKDYGMSIAADAHEDESIQRAVIGGVTTIEYGTFMSTETMELMKKHGTYYVPAITAGKEVEKYAKIKGFFPDIIASKALTIGSKIQNTFKNAYKKGVKIAFGTDAGVFPHGQNGKEFGFMVIMGMPAMETIQSATITNAKILNMENKLGQLKKGFYADIIAVNDDPTKKISTMENVIFVMKNGEVIKN